MINVILCGGSGTRLWPISRGSLPKQFHPLYGENTLFQQTYLRNSAQSEHTLIVLNSELYYVALDQLKEVGAKEYTLLVEEEGRDTAAAIALAAFHIEKNWCKGLMMVTPSDHVIKQEENYHIAVNKAIGFARNDKLVVFGITPTHPETGYGYIERKDEFEVERFVEKPDKDQAEEFLNNNNFFWNSGMFMLSSSLYLRELKKNALDVYDASRNVYAECKENLRFIAKKMQTIPKISIDYAVIEKSERLKMVYGDFGWSDLGSFDSLYAINEKDNMENVLKSKTLLINSHGNYFESNDRIITAIDIDDLVIVDSDDALLITKRGSTQVVKELVGELKKNNENLVRYHSKVFRPWGQYKVLEEDNSYKIKKIVVHPKGKLSLQKHKHRSEHWIVVSGVANVTKGTSTHLVKKNESIYISAEEVHRIENPYDEELILIEVQVGDYLGEDDIIRLDDIYKRI